MKAVLEAQEKEKNMVDPKVRKVEEEFERKKAEAAALERQMEFLRLPDLGKLLLANTFLIVIYLRRNKTREGQRISACGC